MANSRLKPPARYVPDWPAWLTSAVFHASLLLLAWALLCQHAPPGVVDPWADGVGIVLLQMASEEPLLEEKETESVESPELLLPTESLLDVLPSETELPSTQASLPHPQTPFPAISLDGLDTGDLGDAASMLTGGKPAKRAGGQTRVRVFGVEGVGTKFVYLFDRSVSMDGPLLAAAKEQLIASLQSLESVHQFQIIFFNYQVQLWDMTGGQNRIAFATDRNKQLARQFVRSITAMGGTLRLEALRRAIAMRPDVIFFLTDVDNPMAADDLAISIRQAHRNSTAIHTIEFGFSAAQSRENFLIQLARETGGQYDYVDTSRFSKPRK